MDMNPGYTHRARCCFKRLAGLQAAKQSKVQVLFHRRCGQEAGNENEKRTIEHRTNNNSTV